MWIVDSRCTHYISDLLRLINLVHDVTIDSETLSQSYTHARIDMLVLARWRRQAILAVTTQQGTTACKAITHRLQVKSEPVGATRPIKV